MNNLSFKFEEDGEEYKVLRILTPQNLPYQYLIYTDDSNNIFASRYKVNNGLLELSQVEEEIEWNYINNNYPEVNKNGN